MKKTDIVKMILKDKLHATPREQGSAFCPTNIALCKYWGKRDPELNLPMTPSLSIALPTKGAQTTITCNDQQDIVFLNGQMLAAESHFVKRLFTFLDLFHPSRDYYFKIDIDMNLPVAAGLASSACGFASIVCALNALFDWELSRQNLSILARLGSGSAARSLWNGFVEWHAGVQSDGMDSFASPIPVVWPDLRIGILTMSSAEKSLSSREAMQRTIDTSVLYQRWPQKVVRDLVVLRQAIQNQHFSLLAGTAESNALSMHATMLSAWPPICYSLPETLAAMQQVWALRSEGLSLYFTQDAGPNLKLLFLAQDEALVRESFPAVEVIDINSHQSTL